VARKALCIAGLACAGIVCAMGVSLFFLGGGVASYTTDVGCTMLTIPRDLLMGANYSTAKFVGLDPLYASFDNLAKEMQNLTQVNSDVEAIQNKKLGDFSTASSAKLAEFYNKYKASQVTDGTGAKATPLSVSSLTDKINPAIELQFGALAQVATQLSAAAASAKDMISNSGSTYGGQITQVLEPISTLKTSLITFYSSMDKAQSLMQSGGKVSSLGLIGLLIIILAHVSLQALFLVCMNVRNKCLNHRCLMKIVLLLSALVAFLLVLIALVFFVMAMVTGTGCAILGELLSANSTKTYFDGLGITVDSNITSMMDTCLVADAKGDVMALFNTGSSTPALDSAKSLINGFSQLTAQRANLTAANADPASVIATALRLEMLRTGTLLDFANVADTLSGLNSLASCAAGTQFVLNQANCSSAAGCQVIKAGSTATIPSCTSDAPAANKKYTDLQNYITDEAALQQAMLGDLNKTAGGQSVYDLYFATFSSIIAVLPNVDKIQATLQQTMSTIGSISTGGGDSTYSCKILRVHLQLLQGSMCLKKNKNFSDAFRVLLILTIMLVVGNWLFYFSLKCATDVSGEEVANLAKPPRGDREN